MNKESIRPGSIIVDEIALFTERGEQYNITQYVETFSIFEDVFSNVLSGTAIILDNLNLLGSIPVIGREIINVRCHVPGFDNVSIQRAFYVYSVENRSATSQDRQQMYELHFMSLEGMIDNVTFLSKKFTGATDELVSNIFTEYLQLPRLWDKSYPFPAGLSKNNSLLAPEWKEAIPKRNLNQLNVGGNRPFKSKVTFVAAMWSPLKTINWLSTHSIDGSTEGANVLFWESSQGFYFSSIDSVIEAQSNPRNRKNYYYGLDDAAIDLIKKKRGGSSIAKGYEKVENVTIPTMGDTLRSQDFGHLSSNMHVIDINTKDYKEYIFDYPSNFETFKHTDGARPAFNVNQTRNVYSYRTFKTKHRKLFNDYVEPGYETWVLQRNSLLYDLSNLRVEITVPGYCRMEVGEVINFYYPRMGEKNANEKLEDLVDPYLSGSYLVVAVRHIVGREKYTMRLELVKESLASNLV